MSEIRMTNEEAMGGHSLSGGTIASGGAVCECGTWRAADYYGQDRKAARRDHLAAVERRRKVILGGAR